MNEKITYKLQKTEQSDFFIERPKNKTYKNLKLEPTSLNNNVFCLLVDARHSKAALFVIYFKEEPSF